jgi:ABC-type nitrate/sulfonate/bicarbonate transport system substrate-binding protein
MRVTARAAMFCLLLLAACGRDSSPPGADAAARLPELKLTVFAAPSQSIWLPTLIKALKLDEKQGFTLIVTPKPGQVAYTDFASGADPVCYCAAPAAVARFVEQGAEITLLWNVFDLDYFIVTKEPGIRAVADLAGRNIGADTSTGLWAIGAWLLQQNGVPVEQLHIQSAFTPSLLASMATGRLDAVLFGPIETASLIASPGGDVYRAIKINRESVWQRYGLHHGIPSIAFGAWRSWIAEPNNRELARKFYRANLEAAEYLRSQPAEAAKIISAATSISEDALKHLFVDGAPMIDIRPASEYAPAIKLLTQDLMPAAHQLERPLTDAELSAYVSDFKP